MRLPKGCSTAQHRGRPHQFWFLLAMLLATMGASSCRNGAAGDVEDAASDRHNPEVRIVVMPLAIAESDGLPSGWSRLPDSLAIHLSNVRGVTARVAGPEDEKTSDFVLLSSLTRRGDRVVLTARLQTRGDATPWTLTYWRSVDEPYQVGGLLAEDVLAHIRAQRALVSKDSTSGGAGK